MASKEIDRWLKSEIEKVPEKRYLTPAAKEIMQTLDRQADYY